MRQCLFKEITCLYIVNTNGQDVSVHMDVFLDNLKVLSKKLSFFIIYKFLKCV